MQVSAGLSATPTDALGDLRSAFNRRLREDRRRLVTLRATMLYRQQVAAATFDEMHFLAHRMCGAAAIFAFPLLAAAAHLLIDEVSARRVLKAGINERPSFLTLDALINLLFRMDEQPPHDSRKNHA
jgi:Hpt domain